MSFIEKYYKLEKKLFEEEKYKDVKLNSKVAYAILKYMVENNINIKIDKEGKKYIENSRDYIKQKMNLSINTITSIYKELIKLDLIEEKWIEVGKPNIVYIKNCESEEAEEKHNICEKEKNSNKDKFIMVKEITVLDSILANEFINKVELKKFDFEYKKIEKVILWNQYTSNEKDLIRIALRYITRKKEREDWDELIKYIDNDLIQEALFELKQSKRNGNICGNFINIIHDKIKNYTT